MPNTVCIDRKGQVVKQEITTDNIDRAFAMGYGIEMTNNMVMAPNGMLVPIRNIEALVENKVICFDSRILARLSDSRVEAGVRTNPDGSGSFIGRLVGMGF